MLFKKEKIINSSSSISFHKASAGVNGPSSAAAPSPPHMEDRAQYVLMYQTHHLQVHKEIFATSPNECGTPP